MAGGVRLSLQVERNPRPFIRLHPDHKESFPDSEQTGQDYTLGPRQGKIPVVFTSDVSTQTVVLSSQFAHDLGIRRFMKSLTATVDHGKVNFGTVIGILCSPQWNETKQTLRTTKQTPILKKLLEVGAKEGTVCYVFGLKDIHWGRMRVIGYQLDQGQWTQREFPLPNVIYDQVISRKQEHRKSYAQTRQNLLSLYGDKWFNQGFLDKWKVHEWMLQDPRTSTHVPATQKFTTASSAIKFFRDHPIVYCKPVHGSLGLGIFRIERQIDGAYVYQIKQRHGLPSTHHAATSKDLLNSLKNRLRAQPYLLQEGITLAQLEERPFDIRIVMQRDGKGQWKRTKMFARIAEKGSITSNLTTGGEPASLETILASLFMNRAQRRRVLQQLRSLSRIVPEVVEHQSNLQFGELGLDFGLDNEGGVWIIEVNSKPWKTTATTKGRQDLVDLSFERPIQYAYYLANRPD